MRRCLRLPSLILFVAAFGCNSHPATVAIHGEVTFEGHAIEKGKIDFVPIDNTPGASAVATITAGKYDIPAKWGPLSDGSYLVQIVGYRKSNRTEPNRLNPGGSPLPIEENYIPPAYNSQSTLKVRVSELSDKTHVDFQLAR